MAIGCSQVTEADNQVGQMGFTLHASRRFVGQLGRIGLCDLSRKYLNTFNDGKLLLLKTQ